MTLGGSGELDCRAGNQCGAENGENGFAHYGSPHALCGARQRASRISAAPQIRMLGPIITIAAITKRRANFLIRRRVRLIIQQLHPAQLY
jgi:hypothetical protein